MLFVRLSLIKPLPGHEKRVAELNQLLLEFFRLQDGFVRGFALDPIDETGEIGRLTMWESQEIADAVARQQHGMSLRSEMLQVIDAEEHWERAFHATETSPAPAPGRP